MQTSTESNYPVKRALSLLSQEQRDAAARCLLARPPVIGGTRVIMGAKARLTWFNFVSAEMERLRIHKNQRLVNAFCDLAGVPD